MYCSSVQVGILGTLTFDGWLIQMALATELDVELMCSLQVITSGPPVEDVQQSILVVLAYS